MTINKIPRWLIILVSVGAFIGCCLIVAADMSLKVNAEYGGYGIESVTLGRLQGNQSIDVKDVFSPSDTIVCTVKTTGIDSIVSMRWLLGDKLIYEVTGRTQNNRISSVIQSNSSAILAEGRYRVEIFILDKERPLKTVYFEVKAYHPTVNPPISIPAAHKSIETPWFPEVPFAFDETWKIGDAQWKVNEVKVVLRDDVQEYFMAILIETDMNDIIYLTESKAKEITRPIALYALENGYLGKAKKYEIDGRHYDLDQSIFVILLNPATDQLYRVQFAMKELK